MSASVFKVGISNRTEWEMAGMQLSACGESVAACQEVKCRVRRSCLEIASLQIPSSSPTRTERCPTQSLLFSARAHHCSARAMHQGRRIRNADSLCPTSETMSFLMVMNMRAKIKSEESDPRMHTKWTTRGEHSSVCRSEKKGSSI